jgi:tetratricopeptide (TPR) repeat protein
VLTNVARYDEALEVLEEAAAAYESLDDLEGLAQTMAKMGLAHSARGTPAEGITGIEGILDRFSSSGPTRTVAALYSSLSQLCFRCARYRDALRFAEQCGEMARTIGDVTISAEAGVGRGSNLLMLGRLTEARAELEKTIPLAEAGTNPVALAHALNNAGATYLLAGDLGRCGPYYERALAVGERIGERAWVAFVMANLGKLDFLRGDWHAARQRLERAVEIIRTLGPSWYAAYPVLYLGQVVLTVGALEEAARLLNEAVLIAEVSEDLHALRLAHSLLAERDLSDGDPVMALRRLDPLLDRPGVEEQDVLAILPVLASARLAAGQLKQAESTASDAITRATSQGFRLFLIDALRVHGEVLATRGCWTEARARLAEALSMAQDVGYPHAEARVHLKWASLAARAGETVQSANHHARAREILQRLGARLEAYRAVRNP